MPDPAAEPGPTDPTGEGDDPRPEPSGGDGHEAGRDLPPRPSAPPPPAHRRAPSEPAGDQ